MGVAQETSSFQNKRQLGGIKGGAGLQRCHQEKYRWEFGAVCTDTQKESINTDFVLLWLLRAERKTLAVLLLSFWASAVAAEVHLMVFSQRLRHKEAAGIPDTRRWKQRSTELLRSARASVGAQ